MKRKTKEYTRLSLCERELIMRKEGIGKLIQVIAKETRRSPSTISRELVRKRRYAWYSPDYAYRQAPNLKA